MFFSQTTLVAVMLAAASAVMALPAPAKNTGTNGVVNGVTYTNSRNGADVACTRGASLWCVTRRNEDGEEIPESGLDFDVDAGADVEIQDAGFFNPSDDFEDSDDSSVTSSDSTTA